MIHSVNRKTRKLFVANYRNVPKFKFDCRYIAYNANHNMTESLIANAYAPPPPPSRLTHTHTHTHTRTHARTHTRARARTHTNTHTHRYFKNCLRVTSGTGIQERRETGMRQYWKCSDCRSLLWMRQSGPCPGDGGWCQVK